MANTIYIFYGVEIPKDWEHWPSAWGNTPLNINYRNLDITVPNIGGEPVFRNDRAITVKDFGLTLFRYPHTQEDVVLQNNLGIIGYPIVEVDKYEQNNVLFDSYNTWKQNYTTGFDIEIQNICKVIGVDYYQPNFVVCDASCDCC